jgi:hypothetical protein
MARPTKAELLGRFFPEIREKSSKGDKQAAIAYNTLACEVVLADQLRLFDAGRAKHGPGVLCVRLQRGDRESSYLAASDLQMDLDMAASQGHTALETFLSDVLSQLSTIDPEKAGLVLLLDNSSAQLFPIPRDYPARGIQSLLEEFAA